MFSQKKTKIDLTCLKCTLNRAKDKPKNNTAQ